VEQEEEGQLGEKVGAAAGRQMVYDGSSTALLVKCLS